MEPVLDLINFARMLGSLLCFQWEEATFRVGNSYFPVCAGCFGIYLGSLIAFSIFPFLKDLSRRLYSIKHGLPLVLPMVVYWAILNIERAMGVFPIPGIKELYCFTGILLGLTVSNAAYNLCLETRHATTFTEVGRKLWILPTLLTPMFVAVFLAYRIEIAITLTASLVFLAGFAELVGYIFAWATESIFSGLKRAKPVPSEAVTSVLRISAILVCFILFQILILESRPEFFVLGILFGLLSLGAFGRSLRDFTLKELGVVRKGWFSQLVYGILIGFSLYGVWVVYRSASSSFYEVVFPQFSFDFLGVLIMFAIVVSEEFFFRGYAVHLLERHMNIALSCILSSFLFTIYHESAMFKPLVGGPVVVSMDFEHMLTLFAGGLLLSFFFVKKRSLVMPIVTHFVWNFLVLGTVTWQTLPLLPH